MVQANTRLPVVLPKHATKLKAIQGTPTRKRRHTQTHAHTHQQSKEPLPLQRAAPGAGALEEDMEVGLKAPSLEGGGMAGTRRSPGGAALLGDPLRSPSSAEAGSQDISLV